MIHRETSIDETHEETVATSRRGFLGLGAVLAVGRQFLAGPVMAADG